MQGSVPGTFLVAGVIVVNLGFGACAPEGSHPPVARIQLTPATIPEHDGFQTAVTLDGSASADPVDDPEAAQPLEFSWRVLGDEFRYESGSERDAVPVVGFRGHRPATIELTVMDGDGDASTARVQMQLTVSP